MRIPFGMLGAPYFEIAPMWLRTLYTMASHKRRGSASVLDETVISGRVLPNDLDFNVHVNNGRYLSLADLGRIDYFFRTGLFQAGMQRGWAPIIATGVVRFSRPLKPFQRYTLKNRLLGWDEKWAFMEHRFFADNRKGETKLFASVVIKGAFVTKQDGQTVTVLPQDLMDAVGEHHDSPPIPQWVRDWQRGEDAWREDSRAQDIEVLDQAA